MKYKVNILIVIVVLSCIYCFGGRLHIAAMNLLFLQNDNTLKKESDSELSNQVANRMLKKALTASQEGDYVGIISSYKIDPTNRENSYTTEVFAKILDNGVAVDAGDITVGNLTISTDSNNLYQYSFPLSEGKSLLGDSIDVEVNDPSVAQRRLTRIKMVVPKALYPSTISLPKMTIDRTIGYSLNWAPDPNNQFGEVQIQLSYCKGISKYYDPGMPNAITDLVYRVTDNGNFTIPQSDLARFPKGSYVSLSICRAWLNNVSGKIAYVAITEASTPPLPVIESEPEETYFSVSGVEFSSNGFGQGSTLCTHDYDFDDYANTFSIDLSTPITGPVNLEYMIFSSSTGSLVHQGTITNFIENHDYSLPPALSPGFYSISVKIPGHPFTDEEWHESVFEYIDCNATLNFTLSSFPNPASNELTISIGKRGSKSFKNTSESPFEIVLFDFNQRRIVQKWSLEASKSNAILDVSGIKDGQYVLIVRNQKGRQAKQIIIKR